MNRAFLERRESQMDKENGEMVDKKTAKPKTGAKAKKRRVKKRAKKSTPNMTTAHPPKLAEAANTSLNKAAFVRQYPNNTPKEIEGIAMRQLGVKVSQAYVAQIRFKDRQTPDKAPKRRGRPPGVKAPEKASSSRESGFPNTPLEHALVSLASQYGLEKAEKLINTTRVAIQRVIDSLGEAR